MKKNKLVSILLVLFCAIFLVGCAEIEYQRITDDTGKIIDKLVIEIDEKDLAIRMNPDKIQALKQDIKKDFQSYALAVNNAKKYLHDNNTDIDLDYNEGITVEHTDWTLVDNNKYRIMLQMVFLNSTYYEKLFTSDDSEDESEEETPTEIVSGMFISKYVMYSTNVFSGIEEVSGGMDSKNYFDYYTKKYGEYSLSDVKLTQIYGTTDKRLKSNADYTEQIEGINYHLWEIDTKNADYKTMKLSYYYTTAVGTGWYIIALAVSIGLAILLIIVYIIKVIKNRRYRKKVPIESIIAQELEKDE